MAALLFVTGLAPQVPAEAAQAAFALCDAGAQWTPSAASPGSGFLRISIEGAAHLMRICSSEPASGLSAVPDSQISMQCASAVESMPPSPETLAAEVVNRLRVAAEGAPVAGQESTQEEQIKRRMRLEPRADNMNDEMWDQVKRYRRMQAETELRQDAERTARVMKAVRQRLDERERSIRARENARAQNEGEEQKQGEQQGDKAEVAARGREAQAQPDAAAKSGNSEPPQAPEATPAEVKKHVTVPPASPHAGAAPGADAKPKSLEGIVASNVEEMLGQIDSTLVAHITGLVEKGASQAAITAEVQPILEEDASAFAASIFEQVKQQNV